ncbi:MAG: hypothetical protein MK132_03350 [Lentisphaerales bacterium]|nr:hypothetical protein [Lentisphaerales bacterium]
MLKFFIILLFSCTLLHADDWYYGTGLDGEKKEFHGSENMHYRFLTAPARKGDYWERKLAKFEVQVADVAKRLKSETDQKKKYVLSDDLQKLRNNRARCLILLGRVSEAKKLLLDIEKKFPGESTIAENLATCYDLEGKPVKALAWINKAGERNSMSIYSNLWVYKKILEARIKVKEDKDYLSTNAVSGQDLDVTSAEVPFIEVKSMEHWSRRFKLGSAAKHIREQIQQRLQIEKTEKDPVIACLIEELASMYAISEVCEIAEPVYDLAIKYGHPRPEMVKSRKAQMQRLISSNKESMSYSRSFADNFSQSTKILIAAVSALLLLILFAWWNSERKGRAQ